MGQEIMGGIRRGGPHYVEKQVSTNQPSVLKLSCHAFYSLSRSSKYPHPISSHDMNNPSDLLSYKVSQWEEMNDWLPAVILKIVCDAFFLVSYLMMMIHYTSVIKSWNSKYGPFEPGQVKSPDYLFWSDLYFPDLSWHDLTFPDWPFLTWPFLT